MKKCVKCGEATAGPRFKYCAVHKVKSVSKVKSSEPRVAIRPNEWTDYFMSNCELPTRADWELQCGQVGDCVHVAKLLPVDR